jgi:hypothetical protein
MRTCLAISAIIHAAIMLWVVFAPGSKPFDPAHAEPILVDLLPPQEVPRVAEREPFESEPPKSELSKPAPQKAEPPKPVEASQKPAPKGSSKTTAADSVEDQAATAARLAWMLNLPTASSVNLAAPPSETKSNLASEEIAQFKAQVGKCWVAPAGLSSTPGFEVSIRVALNPDGSLGAEPELIRAPASLAGPPLVESAKRALKQCQPYGGLPADKYKDWKILELSFSLQGPSDVLRPPAGKSSR